MLLTAELVRKRKELFIIYIFQNLQRKISFVYEVFWYWGDGIPSPQYIATLLLWQKCCNNKSVAMIKALQHHKICDFRQNRLTKEFLNDKIKPTVGR